MGDLPLTTKDYDDFSGKIIEQMPLLIAQGRTPLSAADLMRQRIWALSQPEDVKNAWWNNYFHLGDAVLYHPDGKIKIELDSQLLRQLNAQSQLQNGLSLITDETYITSKGKEFSRDELLPLDTPLGKTAILSNPLWNYLAREDKLLKEYTEAVFEEGKQFDYDSNMGIYLRIAPKSTPLAGALCVYGFNGGSNLGGDDGLDSGSGRLVGVAPEAHGENKTCAKRTAQKQAPTLDLVLRTIEQYTAPANRQEIEKALRKHYK
ncbi:MAG: hypothetical protein AABX47_05220 [Nanoarchaeota archaeon]